MPHPILSRAVGLYRTSRYGTVSVCRVAHVLHARGVVRFDSSIFSHVVRNIKPGASKYKLPFKDAPVLPCAHRGLADARASPVSVLVCLFSSLGPSRILCRRRLLNLRHVLPGLWPDCRTDL